MSEKFQAVRPLIVNFGGGTNSAALIVGLKEKGITPDAIIFADTGGEKPHTYQFVEEMSLWCASAGFPPVITVRNDGMYDSLESNCLKKSMLPSLAYGFKSCSDKYKKRPVEKWATQWQPARICWDAGGKVRKMLGFDAGEARRSKIKEDQLYRYEYPLIEWDWDREDCVAAIKRSGLSQPGKSSCFFCPAAKKAEILDLQRRYPDLADRAIAMERNANLQTMKGLGRSFSWEQFLKADEAQGKLFPEVIDQACGCYDGGDDE